MSNYPSSMDSFEDPDADTPLNDSAVPHAQLHQKVNSAIMAIQTTLGINPQGNYGSATPDATPAVNSSTLTIAGRLNDIEDQIYEVRTSAFGRLPNDSVNTLKIQDNAVTSAKLAVEAGTTDKIASNAVTNGKIAVNSITGDKLQPSTVTYTELKSFTKLHISRPDSTPQRLSAATPPYSSTTLTWLDEVSLDPDNLIPATPIGAATPSANVAGRYAVPQSTIVIPADSSYNGTWMISMQVKGLRGAFYDNVCVNIKDGSNNILNTFYAASAGTGHATVSSVLNHVIDLKQSYRIEVQAYNAHSASPAYLSGDLYLIKLSK